MGSHLLFLGVLVAVGLAVAERVVRGGRHRGRDWPVYVRSVLTDAERAFYARLCGAVSGRLVLCQVQIGQFVEVRNVPGRRGVRNRYDRLSADFVVCGEDFRPLVVVELDDASHDRSAQRARDAKKDAVLSAAGVPIVRFRGLVSVERIREDVLKAVRSFDEGAGGLKDVGGSGRKVPRVRAL